MKKEATFPTPHGDGVVVVQHERLVEVRWPHVGEMVGRAAPAPPARGSYAGDPRAAVPERSAAPAHPPARPTDAAVHWAWQLAAYFRGERRGWTDAEVGLDAYGFTPFRTAVYRALLEVPAGAVVTYGELARRAGHPRAARAVGSAMAENPIAIVVPCHRVVRTDGSLGHYGFGDPWKRFLLEAEGAFDDRGSETPGADGRRGGKA
ncbi:MAG: methylated-DNA--[protein]-cysteine S-methyltransferase [Thermoleophilia bacterium]